MFVEKVYLIELIVLMIKLGIRIDFFFFVLIKGLYMSCIIVRMNVKSEIVIFIR